MNFVRVPTPSCTPVSLAYLGRSGLWERANHLRVLKWQFLFCLVVWIVAVGQTFSAPMVLMVTMGMMMDTVIIIAMKGCDYDVKTQ